MKFKLKKNLNIEKITKAEALRTVEGNKITRLNDYLISDGKLKLIMNKSIGEFLFEIQDEVEKPKKFFSSKEETKETESIDDSENN